MTKPSSNSRDLLGTYFIGGLRWAGLGGQTQDGAKVRPTPDLATFPTPPHLRKGLFQNTRTHKPKTLTSGPRGGSRKLERRLTV